MRVFLSLALLFSFSVMAQESTEYKYEVEANKAEYYIGSYKKGKKHGVWKLQYHFFMIHLKHRLGASATILHNYYLKNIG